MEILVLAAVLFVLYRLLNRRAVPAAAHAGLVGPVGWSAGTNWRVVGPLGRADLRRLLRHPAFIAGVLLTPMMLLAATEGARSWLSLSAQIALGLVPLGWLTIVAVNLVALRPRRTGTDELFATLPAPQPVRSSALLTTAIGPVAVAAAAAIATVVIVPLVAVGGNVPLGSPRWDEIAAGLLIVAGSVTVGVAVARWLPNAAFGLLAAVATMVIQARFLDVTTWPWDRGAGDPLRFLGFLAEPNPTRADFLEVRPAGWHLLYLLGLIVFMGGVAVARDGLRRPAVAVLSAGVLVAAGAGWIQTRPPSAARQAEMVAFLTDPVAHQVCKEAGAVRYCAYPGFTAEVPRWRQRVEATLALVPAAATAGRDPLAVTQRAATIVSNDCSPGPFEANLPPGVAARVSPASLWPADGDVHPPLYEESFPCSEQAVHGFFLAVQTGAWATGLPSAPHDRNQRCTASGQARAAVTLWAGAAASPKGARTLRDVTAQGGGDQGGGLITFTGWDDPPMWGVDYAVADAEVAIAMLARPAPTVTAALEADWARWTNPATPTTALARALGIDGPNPAAPLPAGSPCP